jgi:hypothetical protein
MCAVLRPKPMLVRMEKLVLLPYSLDSFGHHTRPELPYDFEEGYRSYFIQIVRSLDLGKERHESILPPLWYVVVCPHYL